MKTIFRLGITLLTVCFLLTACDQQEPKVDLTTNNLDQASSPYLLQHATNPVHWQEWKEPVLVEAQKTNKPLLISIGYAACHWCHVMEEESFEDVETASYMNEHFVNIKVDREERPDVDQVYLKTLELMTGSGGWPLNVIALPDGRPVWAGTYLPQEEWLSTLKQTRGILQNTPNKAEEYAQKIHEGLLAESLLPASGNKARFRQDEVESAVNRWRQYLDLNNGGLKTSEKFMLPASQEFLLQYAYLNNDNQLLNYMDITLTNMSRGGIYDVVGGGFSRYTTDSLWRVPHFEKMLYDNAQLASLYAKAFKATGDADYLKVAEQTLNFVQSELALKNGLYASSLDADSQNEQGEKIEGAYYTWSENELKQLLQDDFEAFALTYDINPEAVWEEDQYILYQSQSDQELAEALDMELTIFQQQKKHWLEVLKTARLQRAQPSRDDKALVSWNALTVIAFLQVYEAQPKSHYLTDAKELIASIERHYFREGGRLFHSFKDDKASINAYLLDYASLASAYIQLYQHTGEQSWLDKSRELVEIALEDFDNPDQALLYFASSENQQLMIRTTEILDQVIPSSNALMAENLFLLSHYYGIKTYDERARAMLNLVKEQAIQSGAGHAKWLDVMNNYSQPFYEIAVVGKDAVSLSRKLKQEYLPQSLLAQGSSPSDSYLLKNRFLKDKTLIYVCRNNTCKLPVTSVAEAMELLQ
ncbi:thioredoxin domain-containing protein [Nonlabens xiamenensis]|uniref:thioredoxin domain-containing protein n=1 Tax=Nonlabens xiamenensis TaxID=2341043 RepID=UPI0013DE217D|nr:thioredoxin domain-containing protein [Nonlabens xiamenensis]